MTVAPTSWLVTRTENTNSIAGSPMSNCTRSALSLVVKVITLPATEPVAGDTNALNAMPGGSVSVKTRL